AASGIYSFCTNAAGSSSGKVVWEGALSISKTILLNAENFRLLVRDSLPLALTGVLSLTLFSGRGSSIGWRVEEERVMRRGVERSWVGWRETYSMVAIEERDFLGFVVTRWVFLLDGVPTES